MTEVRKYPTVDIGFGFTPEEMEDLDAAGEAEALDVIDAVSETPELGAILEPIIGKQSVVSERTLNEPAAKAQPEEMFPGAIHISDKERRRQQNLPGPDLFPGATELTPVATLGEKATTAGQGVLSGLLQGGPVIAGAVRGARLGAAAAATAGLAFPPIEPIVAPIGFILGGAVGAYAGAQAAEEGQRQLSRVYIPGTEIPLVYDNIQSVPPHLRSWASGAETFGASIPFAGLPLSAAARGAVFSPVFQEFAKNRALRIAQKGVNLPGKLAEGIVNQAGAMPWRYAVAEFSAAGSAGGGAFIAEEVRPGEMGPRILGETIGGVANPARWLLAATTIGYISAKKVFAGLGMTSLSNSEEAATRKILEAFAAANENPLDFAEQLRLIMAENPQLDLFPSQLLPDSRALQSLMASLRLQSGKFSNEFVEKTEEALLTMRRSIIALESSGDPQALIVAAQMRDDYLQGLLDARLATATDKVLEMSSLIDPFDAKSMAEYSVMGTKIMGEALEEVRAIERSLYAKVDETIIGNGDSIIAALDEIKPRIRERSTPVPEWVGNFIKRIAGDEDTSEAANLIQRLFGDAPDAVPAGVTSGELMEFRSEMLQAARKFAANLEFNEARQAGILADAALADLEVIFKNSGSTSFVAANSYSRLLHETFTRTFAGDTLAKDRTGASRLVPEVLYRQAFTGTKELVEVNLNDLQRAAQMAGEDFSARMLELQDQAIRVAAKEILDPATNKATLANLTRFKAKYRPYLESPQGSVLARNIEDTVKADEFLRRTKVNYAKMAKRLREKSGIKLILRANGLNEDPAKAVNEALTGGSPEHNFRLLTRLANRAGPEARAGLETSIYNHAYTKAGGDNFSWTNYKAQFEKPLTLGGPSLNDLMVANGFASADEMTIFFKFLDKAISIEALMKKGVVGEDDIFQLADAVSDLVLRVSGARFGRLFSGGGGGHELIIAGASSRAARQVFDKIPENRVKQALIAISKSPELMASALESSLGPKQKARFLAQMNAFIWQEGLGSVQGDTSLDIEPDEE